MIEFDENDRALLGPVSAEQRWDGAAGALPAWLSTMALTGDGAGATYDLADPATGRPGLTMKTAKRASAMAVLSASSLDATKYRAIRFRASMQMPPEGTSVGIFMFGLTQQPTASRGLAVGKFGMGTEVPTQLRVTAAGTNRYVLTDFPFIQNNRKYDLSILLDCVDKDVYLMLGDAVIDMWPGAASYLELGSVTPSIRVTNNAGTAEERGVIIDSVTLQRWI